ncbi:hypothetical protein H0H93_002339 [Arthromyces matolae]|nr:hypothetical protein H0H93_002339 [Arthromyces matolae]
MLYGTITEFCTPQEVPTQIHIHAMTDYLSMQCPIMSAGPRYEYLWEDGQKYKRPTKLPAPEYVDALMNWAQGLLDDEAVFPNKIGVSEFVHNPDHPAQDEIVDRYTVPPHVPGYGTVDCQAVVQSFDLVDKKELAPLDELNDAILAEDRTR